MDMISNLQEADAGGVFIGEEISIGGVSCLDANLDGFNMALSVEQYIANGMSEVPSKEQIRTAILIAGIEAKNVELVSAEANISAAH